MSDSPPEPDVPGLRDRISELDSRLIELLAERRRLSEEVARVKDQAQAGIRDRQREEELLARLVGLGRQAGLDGHYVTRVFHEILDDSVRLQQGYLQRLANPDSSHRRLRVAIQGVAGAYSHLAARKHFAKDEDDIRLVECERFTDALDAVEQGRADYALLPIENTTSGSINEAYDLLLGMNLSIVGEELYRVDHCLIGAEDVPLSQIERVFSHPQAVAQCTEFLGQMDWKVETYVDTAKSVVKLQEDGDPAQAAIASEDAARRYGLPILARGIANQRQNYTRFLVAASEPRKVDLRVACKTSCVMATGQQAGSLVEALLVFKEHGIPLTKLESRPILGNPFEEMFYLDFQGNVDDDATRDCLRALKRVTQFVKVLGSYPSRHLPKTELPPRALAEADGPNADAAVESQTNDRTVIRIGSTDVGGKEPVVLAGPPSVGARSDALGCARTVQEGGGSGVIVQAGVSADARQWLVEASQQYGLAVLAELTDPDQVSDAGRWADALMVPGDEMRNGALLRAVGRCPKPVVLARSSTASLDEWLEALARILDEGNQRVVLCEQGVRTLDSGRTLDLGAIPALRARTHLPVLVDPRQLGVDASLILPQVRAAVAAGGDGALLALALDPEHGPGVTPIDFRDLMRDLFAGR